MPALRPSLSLFPAGGSPSWSRGRSPGIRSDGSEISGHVQWRESLGRRNADHYFDGRLQFRYIRRTRGRHDRQITTANLRGSGTGDGRRCGGTECPDRERWRRVSSLAGAGTRTFTAFHQRIVDRSWSGVKSSSVNRLALSPLVVRLVYCRARLLRSGGESCQTFPLAGAKPSRKYLPQSMS